MKIYKFLMYLIVLIFGYSLIAMERPTKKIKREETISSEQLAELGGLEFKDIIPSIIDKKLSVVIAYLKEHFTYPLLKTFNDKYAVNSVAFSPDGKLLASGSNDETIKLWDLNTGQEKQIPIGYNSTNSIAFNPDGNLLAFTSGNNIQLWDLSADQKKQTFRGHQETVESVAFSPDGTLLASGSNDQTIKLWDMSGQSKSTHTKDSVISLAWNPKTNLLAAGLRDGAIILWDLNSGQEKQISKPILGAVVTSVAFSPNGNYLASGSWDNTVKLWLMPPAVDTYIESLKKESTMNDLKKTQLYFLAFIIAPAIEANIKIDFTQNWVSKLAQYLPSFMRSSLLKEEDLKWIKVAYHNLPTFVKKALKNIVKIEE